MKKHILAGLILITQIFQNITYAQTPLQKTYDLVSSYKIRDFCDHQITLTFADFSNIKPGNTVWLSLADGIIKDFFEKIHPKIQSPYILVTHGGDHAMPGGFSKYLDDEKIIAWFTQNQDRYHQKLFPLPIGISYYYGYERSDAIEKALKLKIKKELPKDTLLYMNFSTETNPKEREFVKDLFWTVTFCQKNSNISPNEFYVALSRSKFVLSPPGGCEDCFRTWEILAMGSFPIVRSSYLNPLYEDLPVLIIQDWKEITEDFLNKKYEEMKDKKYNYEKLYCKYWFNQINTIKDLYLISQL
ncbi:MAG: hypothetical protein UR26_C0003G0003 [candidate division TM6 bacterium GW2011_GWF2_32_72]|nr:MAG: hypothetical protein UR26_C0003G0003 [candidate division TM6 bacterium GW2011_GWF2_32_72]